MDGKRCRKCGEFRAPGEYYKRRASPDGLQPNCRDCEKRYAKAYYREHKDRYRARNRAWVEQNRERKTRWEQEHHLKKRYGMTLEDRIALSRSQGDRCAICGGNDRLVIDHDHGTGRVRALLCTSCNISLGRFRDDAKLVRSAADYLERHDPVAIEQRTLARARALALRR